MRITSRALSTSNTLNAMSQPVSVYIGNIAHVLQEHVAKVRALEDEVIRLRSEEQALRVENRGLKTLKGWCTQLVSVRNLLMFHADAMARSFDNGGTFDQYQMEVFAAYRKDFPRAKDRSGTPQDGNPSEEYSGEPDGEERAGAPNNQSRR